MSPKAIWAAYVSVGALERGCPNCGAAAGVWCTADDGRRLRRVPCVSRCKADDTNSVASKTAVVQVAHARDYTEPMHPREGDP